MLFLERIRLFIEGIETKAFYRYVALFIASCTLLFGTIGFFYYRRIDALIKQIKRINRLREEDVRVLLEDHHQVEQQRAAVDAILSQDIDFKIAGYFKSLLEKLNLKDKIATEAEAATIEREDNYRGSELNAKFEDLNMKEVTELLQELEQNPRISTKKLEITASKKKQKTLDLQITITTLLPKTEVT